MEHYVTKHVTLLIFQTLKNLVFKEKAKFNTKYLEQKLNFIVN
jgi:hypothetical protein